ncbi:hypothetical protein TNCV_169101 [Trichonephila clavipes]|nr:hypothetical protein TNCV_169101 [Trichonephila clavipes]
MCSTSLKQSSFIWHQWNNILLSSEESVNIFTLGSHRNRRNVNCLQVSDDRRPYLGLGLPPDTIIAHSVQRRRFVRLQDMHIYLFRVIVYTSI